MTETEKLISRALIEGHPEDAARLLEEQPAAAAAVLESGSVESAAAVLGSMAPSQAIRCLQAMRPETVPHVLENLDLEILTYLLRRMPPQQRAALTDALSPARRDPLQTLLEYPPDTAGSVMNPIVLSLPEDISVGEAVARIEQASQELYYYLYVVDREQTLRGVLDLRELMLAKSETPVRQAMHKNVIAVLAQTALASVREHPGWRTFDALPVVNDRGALVGVIRHRVIRQLDQDQTIQGNRQGIETLLALSELYWAGLCGVLGGSLPLLAEKNAPDEGKTDG